MKNQFPNVRHWDMLMLFLSLYVLSALTATLFPIPYRHKEILRIVDFAVCLVFFLDFSARLIKAENKWAYLKWGWIDLLSAIPIFPVLRVGRLFQVYRVIQLLRGFRSAGHVIRHFYRNRAQGAFYTTAMIAFIVLVFGSLAVLEFEIDAPNSTIHNVQDALWWAVVTITTVGYGDYQPVTPGGRIVAVLLMLCGIGLIGTLTGYVASFMHGDEEKSHKSEHDELLIHLREIKEDLARLHRRLPPE